MQNKVFRSGPIALTTTTTTNLLNPPTASGGVNAGSSPQYIIAKHFRAVNKTAGDQTISLWLGATNANAAGTELAWQGTTVPANSYIDYYSPGLRIDSTDFLVGGASAAASITLTIEGEIGVAG
jgi:hypothetical protein